MGKAGIEQINVGLIGFGNIGTGVVNALNRNGNVVEERIGVPVKLTRISDIDIRRKRDVDYDPSILTDNAEDLINDPSIHIIVEVMGGLEPSRTFAEKALRAGKHVVTANKAMLASYGADLWKIAEECGTSLLFEASVGGGIPVIRAMQLGLSANRIRSVYGIVNGTCNYILTNMTQEHKAFQTVLAEAQAHGFAEPDPTYDVEGYDTAHKTAILASLAFQQDIRYTDVFVEGISRIKRVDIDNARDLGYIIKLLGIAKQDDDGRVEVRVHPTLLPRESLLASVNGVFNGIMIEGDLVGRTMFYGRGAGQDPTASAIVSDVMSIAADLVRGAKSAEHRLKIPVGSKNLKPTTELQTSYYVRIQVADRPGVMAQLSGALGNRAVSIRSMIQRAETPNNRAEVIIVTHKTSEQNLQTALKEIAAMDITFEQPFVLRVEE